ncbi:hypothetical protein [Marinifilum flexuosum]|uniref:hypothetical protein n=1 Tax=Marinifilum flexuosum TaxID=1117708 RepID=UPI002494DDEF|nr:hypothetical protein [Marinifilum flexuosum]
MNNFNKDDMYEDMGATYQVYMIHWLNESLKKKGITDKNKRKEIIADFAFPFSVWQDQYWFKDTDGNKVFPCITFSENGPSCDLEINELGKVHFPSSGFSFHDYLNGNLHYYFTEINEDISKIESDRFDRE